MGLLFLSKVLRPGNLVPSAPAKAHALCTHPHPHPQAATNMLLGHFLSLTCALWLLNVVGEGRGDRFQRFLSLDRLKRRAEESSFNKAGGEGAASRESG